ncbi:hypothetical protein BB559_003935 [Furculomyces boomerangus]|uniref:Uncharacterized protein n=1 Tax=Furculomyces boomerangus TaxID=61424 RepID=A0A2T9YHR5_9FUNG|nr:hypothetical protein BB559_003935 [Furculomyces boomerangus]
MDLNKQLSEADIVLYKTNLETDLQAKKTKLNILFQDELNKFINIDKASTKTLSEISKMNQRIAHLKSEWTDNRNNFSSKINSAIELRNNYSSEIKINDHIISILTELSKLNRKISVLDTCIKNQEAEKAAFLLLELENDIENLNIKDTRIYSILKERFSHSLLNIQENVLSKSLEIFSLNSQGNEMKLVINRDSKFSGCLECADVLNFQQEIAEKIYLKVTKNILAFLLDTTHCKVDLETDEIRILKLNTDDPQEKTFENNGFEKLILAFAEILQNRVFGIKYQHLVNNALKIGILDSHWASIISKTFDLDNIAKHNNWEELPLKAKSIEKSLIKCGALLNNNSVPFSKFTEEAEEHYVNSKILASLGSVRKLVLSFKYEDLSTLDAKVSQYAIDGIEIRMPENENFPICMISACAHSLVQQIYYLFSLSISMKKEKSKQLLISSIFSAVDIFICLRYEIHKKNISKASFLSVVYFNDCMFLAYHVRNVINNFRNNDMNKSLIRDKNVVSMLIESAKKSIELLLSKLFSEVSLFINKINGFSNASNPSRNQIMEKELKKALFFIKNTSLSLLSIKDSITLHLYRMIVGSLINNLLKQVYTEIINLDYISSSDSEALNKLFLPLVSLDELLTQQENYKESVHDTTDYVPIKTKFEQMSDIMILSMSEIRSRYEVGLLKCFENKEDLKSLVMALFEDSERRDQLLKKFDE